MMPRISGLVALSLLAALLTPTRAPAQVYRWVDPQGTVRYSEGIDSVPSQFRSTAKPIYFPKSPSPPPTEKPAGSEVERRAAGSADPSRSAAGQQPAPAAEPEKGKGLSEVTR